LSWTISQRFILCVSARSQVSGEDKGANGRLIDTEGKYGIVKLESGTIKAVEYASLVKGLE